MSRFKQAGKVLASFAVSGALVLMPVMPSQAATADDTGVTELIETLSQSSDPEAAFAELSSEQQEDVLARAEVAYVETSSDENEQGVIARARAAAGCYNYTARAAFYNSMGQTLGTMWTTGQTCYNGSTVTSAKFVDGGGATSFIGWSYVGRTSAAGGVSRGGGYSYGAYKFRFGLVAGFQEPVYCARVVGTSVAAHGDTNCGIG